MNSFSTGRMVEWLEPQSGWIFFDEIVFSKFSRYTGRKDLPGLEHLLEYKKTVFSILKLKGWSSLNEVIIFRFHSSNIGWFMLQYPHEALFMLIFCHKAYDWTPWRFRPGVISRNEKRNQSPNTHCVPPKNNRHPPNLGSKMKPVPQDYSFRPGTGWNDSGSWIIESDSLSGHEGARPGKLNQDPLSVPMVWVPCEENTLQETNISHQTGKGHSSWKCADW